MEMESGARFLAFSILYEIILFSSILRKIVNHRNSIEDAVQASHYANMSVQYTAIFHGCKNDNFYMKIFNVFVIIAQNIDCGYTLEPPQRGGSNEYPQSMF